MFRCSHKQKKNLPTDTHRHDGLAPPIIANGPIYHYIDWSIGAQWMTVCGVCFGKCDSCVVVVVVLFIELFFHS